MAMCAKEMKKPFYVLTESFKFSRIYPLNQVDLPNEFKVNTLIHINKLQFLHKNNILCIYIKCIFIACYSIHTVYF